MKHINLMWEVADKRYGITRQPIAIGTPETFRYQVGDVVSYYRRGGIQSGIVSNRDHDFDYVTAIYRVGSDWITHREIDNAVKVQAA